MIFLDICCTIYAIGKNILERNNVLYIVFKKIPFSIELSHGNINMLKEEYHASNS